MADYKLFDDVYKKTGFPYLSDLRTGKDPGTIANAVKAVKVGKYDAQEWNELASYITGEQSDFATAEEAVKFLLDTLQKKE